MRLTQHIALGHLDVVKEKFRRILSLEAQLVEVTTALETLPLRLDQKQRHGMRVVLRIGLGSDDHQVAVDTV